MGEKHSFISMGTVCSITLPDNATEKQLTKVKEAITSVDTTFSRTSPTSELHSLNATHSEIVDDECFALVKKALAFAELTDGAFDPAIGGLVSLWGIATDNPHVPSQEEIAAVDTDWHHITLDETGKRISTGEKLTIDLGGIAKGYAADKAKQVLQEEKITSALVNLGGNVLALGTKPDGSLWKIGVRDPEKQSGEPYIILQVQDKTIVTSGGYERYFVQDGITYHHILDRKTGFPSESDILSATIIGDESASCDALSTALFVLGSEKGLQLIESLEGYDAVVMKTDHSVLFSSHFPYQYTLL